jgi:perosamine synthetase
MNKIYYAKPSITELEIKYATDAAANGWGEHCYDYIGKFENSFTKYINSDFAIATSSCTGALHLGLSALGIKSGDEVIIADINWIASVAPIIYLGAKPVFVDILPDTWCIDPEKVKKAITKNTKAIIAVHLYGGLCEMDELRNISAQYGIPLIEDAAEALGSEYKDKKAGSMGCFGVFSFHGTKTVTTGEGGMLVTSDFSLYEKAVQLNNHGRNPKKSKQFWAEIIGYKYKLSNIQAAIGCAQMERVDELVRRKREIFFKYKELFSSVKGIRMNVEKPDTYNSYWMPTIVFDDEIQFNREKCIMNFTKNNIDGRIFFFPLSSLPMFENIYDNKVSYRIHTQAINLPSYNDISDEEIQFVYRRVIEVLGYK